VAVEILSGMTEPSERDVDDKRGVLAWSFELAPGAETTIKHGYKVTWPKDTEVGQLGK
jgi:hypothetical protein